MITDEGILDGGAESVICQICHEHDDRQSPDNLPLVPLVIAYSAREGMNKASKGFDISRNENQTTHLAITRLRVPR